MQTHEGMPKLFSAAEVAELSAQHSPLDQLELVGPSPGLLCHHCCFPRCPLFLQDLRTEKDRAIETASAHKPQHLPHAPRRRHGLIDHINFFTAPDYSYLPAFHINAQQLLGRSPQMSKDKFIQGMAHCYGMTYDEKKKALGGRPSRGAMGHRDALRLIGELWEQRAA